MKPNVCLSRGSQASKSLASSVWWDGNGHDMNAGLYLSSAVDNASSARRRFRAKVHGGTPNNMLRLLNSIEPA
jgi:hypothetical protein